MDFFDLERILVFLPGIIIGLTVHEFSHAWVAHLSGDPTSKDQGRITLNPVKHIDAIGFLFLIVAGFGWAKPVQFNEEKLRNKIDVVKIAFAGPFSNAVLAMVLSLLFPPALKYLSSLETSWAYNAVDIFYASIYINWGLFIFNLLPIPPLDGSHIFFYPLRRYPDLYNVFYRYGSLLLFALLIVTMISKVNLLPIASVIEFFTKGFLSLIGYNDF